MLYFKGYQAVQVHRIAHELWLGERSSCGGKSGDKSGKRNGDEGGNDDDGNDGGDFDDGAPVSVRSADNGADDTSSDATGN